MLSPPVLEPWIRLCLAVVAISVPSQVRQRGESPGGWHASLRA